MNILYLDWPCFGQVDILFTLEHTLHHHVTKFFHEDYMERESEEFLAALNEVCLNETFDCCFSYNFYPIMAEGCHQHNIKYISLLYDNPFVKLYSYKITYPTNYVFLFDSELYREFKSNGINTVYYMALPVNSEIIDTLAEADYDKERTTCDISFVGTLYDEDHNIFDRMYNNLDSYTKGYLDAIMQAQLRISGYNFIEEVLTGPIISAMSKAEPYEPTPDGVETLANVYSSYYVDRKLTSLERIDLLSAIGNAFPEKLKFFTLNADRIIPNAINMGIADYYAEMPLVFRDSKINLNITLRSIKAGIPLRCMDILGAGGFLLTNYQADLFRHFVPGEDFVYYESKKDLLQKINYYLEHEDERIRIAESGHRKAAMNHSYEKCIHDMFEIALN